MIISHKNRFIFIKTQKTAGTSIEIALSKYCGPDDIITPISPEDEAKRNELGFAGAQNYEIPFSRYSKADYLSFAFHRRRLRFHRHMAASRIVQYIDNETWDSYFKFCFERNPWDKVISWYFWRYKSEPRPTISEFIQSSEANLIEGFELYTIASEIVVDKVFFYEELDDAMNELAERLDLDEPISLPMAKARFRNDGRHFRDILSQPDKEKISKVYAREIAYFNYEW